MVRELPTTITDVAVMRALAHPARISLLEHLSSSGPATATESAEVIGLTPSATSYHLRALARTGLVEEAPGRGDGRERFWRTAVAGGYRLAGGPDADPEVREAKRELLSTFVAWEEAQVRQFMARMTDEPKEWQDATFFGTSTLLLTADELTELKDAVIELLARYSKRTRENPPAGARTVATLFRAFPVS